jgi:hypothetical protein
MKLTPILMVASMLVGLATRPAFAASQTPENRRIAAFLASSAEAETQLSILASDSNTHKTIGEPLLGLTPKLVSYAADSEKEILAKLTDRELVLLHKFFSSRHGASFLRKQDVVAADLSPLLGRELLRTVTGLDVSLPTAPDKAPVPDERSQNVEKLRPLIHELFTESFNDMKAALLTQFSKEGKVEFDKVLRRLNFVRLEEAYCESLKHRLSDIEAQQAAAFFANPEAAIAYQKCAACRRASLCKFITNL